MYFALEPALMRIFGTPELMMKTASWQQEINADIARQRLHLSIVAPGMNDWVTTGFAKGVCGKRCSQNSSPF